MRCCPVESEDTASLEGTKWILTAINGGPLGPDAQGERAPFIEFGVDGEQKIAGFGGCNRFFGTFDRSRSMLKFGPIGATKMACPDMTTEDRFFRALNSVDSVERTPYALILRSDGVEVLRFRPEN